MKKLIDAAFGRSRVVLLVLFCVSVSGLISYFVIPKEAEPDVPIPFFYIPISHQGISPEDGERLLVRPMEKELRSLEGLKELTATAYEGYASIVLEYRPGFDPAEARLDIQEKVDLVKSDLPADSEEPTVNEINIGLFPVLTIGLSGRLPEEQIAAVAEALADEIESIPSVLEAEISGTRDEILEIIVDQNLLESMGVTYSDIFGVLYGNNQLIAAGAMDLGFGRMVLKVPGVIEELDDMLKLPVLVDGSTVVTFGDVATLRRTYKDPHSFARLGGDPAVLIQVSKRLGSNIIRTIESARQVVEASRDRFPEGLEITYSQDKSKQIHDMLYDLQNSVLSAILLVMVVVIAFLGLRPALLVGMAIPGAFLTGILILYLIGMTMNIVVLFSLIMVVGMLVDGAIVTTEVADRKIAEGIPRARAYAAASKRMAWPITASTLTTLAVFLPLTFWPGIIGEFMKYLPITVLFTLSASLLMALIFIPVLGGLIGTRKVTINLDNILQAESGDLNKIGGFTGRYLGILGSALRYPASVFSSILVLIVLSYAAYINFGKGVEFFPDIEPEFLQVQVQARGDLSIYERDQLVRSVETRLLDIPEFRSVYAVSFLDPDQELPVDAVGLISIELIDWDQRRKAAEIIEQMRQRIADVPGVRVQIVSQQEGPGGGKPIQIQITAIDLESIYQTADRLIQLMDQQGGFVDVEDTRPLPGIEWRLKIDREQAARYDVSVQMLGDSVQMLTSGLKLSSYRPDDSDEELDIVMRYPAAKRHLQQLNELKVPTNQGFVPISNFVAFEAVAKKGSIKRSDAKRSVTIKADVEEGFIVDNQVRQLKESIARADLNPEVSIAFKGEDADQREAGIFLMQAFFVAVFSMTVILLVQFNSFYQAALILSAILFSTAGILLGLLITGNTFGIVMCGIGVIALAGIVVNNNIVLIDTYNGLRKQGLAPQEAILRTGAQRLRPVLLTAFTTILGLLPMVFSMNIDLIGQRITFGAPSTQWWVQLASSIAGGLAFATLLTLILTPCLLMLRENISSWFQKRRRPQALRPMTR